MVTTRKLKDLEKEIQNLKSLALFREHELFERKLVPLRGMGRPLVTERKLDKAIDMAKRSLFEGAKDAVRD